MGFMDITVCFRSRYILLPFFGDKGGKCKWFIFYGPTPVQNIVMFEYAVAPIMVPRGKYMGAEELSLVGRAQLWCNVVVGQNV